MRKNMYKRVIDLKCILNSYYEGKTTKEELSLWAKKIYYGMLLGDSIIIEKLLIYNFVRIISRFDMVPNDAKDDHPSTEEEIQEVSDVLNGKRRLSFGYSFKIQRQSF